MVIGSLIHILGAHLANFSRVSRLYMPNNKEVYTANFSRSINRSKKKKIFNKQKALFCSIVLSDVI